MDAKKPTRMTLSRQTKAALAAKRAQGAKLGNPRNIRSAGQLGRTALIASSDEFATNVVPLIRAIQSAGAVTLEGDHPRAQ
jgi:hypothetical protein